MMLNSSIFLSQFNKIEQYLRKVTGEEKTTPFYTLISIAQQLCPHVRYYINDLKEFADLRNAIVHERPEWDVIAEPNDKATQYFKKIVGIITNPPELVSLFVKKVSILGIHDYINKAVSCMLEYNFSQIPIYNGNKFVALLTSNTISRWLGKCVEEDIFSLRETLIQGVLAYKEETNWEENCCFLDKYKNVFNVIEKYRDYEIRGKKLEAILITDSGKSNEKPCGIITAWDLLKIYEKIQLRV